MKTLQNNFTTPEQSKRLLELGVPADSADCFYLKAHPVENYVYVLTDNRTYTEQVAVSEYRYSDFIPCWSAGRLMEIIDICALGENSDPNTEEYPSTIKVMNKLNIKYVEYLVKSMERAVQLGTIDFSELED